MELALLAALALAGCAPVLSPGIVSDPRVGFRDLARDPGRYVGKTVILGGTILNAHNEPDGSSWLEILQRPLGYRQEPQLNDRTDGRFLVKFPQALDAVIYAKDRRITVAAEVIGAQQRKIDQMHYNYPLLLVKEHHLWPHGPVYGGWPQFMIGFGVQGNL
jgi:outer membrane lipoprotein